MTSLRSTASISDVKHLCRVCTSSNLRLVTRVQSPRHEERVPAYRCPKCGHFSFFPTLYPKEKSFDWDGVSYYLDNKDARIKAIVKILDKVVRAYTDIFESRPKSFLDVGCAVGLTVSLAQGRGMHAVGIEPEEKLVQYGVDNLGVDIRQGFLDEDTVLKETFDIIYCEQVLEHVDNPPKFIKAMKGFLSPKGMLYVGVPPVFPINILTTFILHKISQGSRFDDPLNIFYDPDEHINCFTGRSIRYLAREVDLDIRPLPTAMSDLSLPKALLKRLVTAGSNSGAFILCPK